VAFHDPALFAVFDLPLTLPGDGGGTSAHER
jgi:hypothetical protein